MISHSVLIYKYILQYLQLRLRLRHCASVSIAWTHERTVGMPIKLDFSTGTSAPNDWLKGWQEFNFTKWCVYNVKAIAMIRSFCAIADFSYVFLEKVTTKCIDAECCYLTCECWMPIHAISIESRGTCIVCLDTVRLYNCWNA